MPCLVGRAKPSPYVVCCVRQEPNRDGLHSLGRNLKPGRGDRRQEPIVCPTPNLTGIYRLWVPAWPSEAVKKLTRSSSRPLVHRRKWSARFLRQHNFTLGTG